MGLSPSFMFSAVRLCFQAVMSWAMHTFTTSDCRLAPEGGRIGGLVFYLRL